MKSIKTAVALAIATITASATAGSFFNAQPSHNNASQGVNTAHHGWMPFGGETNNPMRSGSNWGPFNSGSNFGPMQSGSNWGPFAGGQNMGPFNGSSNWGPFANTNNMDNNSDWGFHYNNKNAIKNTSATSVDAKLSAVADAYAKGQADAFAKVRADAYAKGVVDGYARVKPKERTKAVDQSQVFDKK